MKSTFPVAVLALALLASAGSRLPLHMDVRVSREAGCQKRPPLLQERAVVGAAEAATAISPVSRLSEARQLMLVVSNDWDAADATLATYDRVDDEWRATGLSTPVMLGRQGTAWGRGLHPAQSGLQKREGDGRAPAGVFEIGPAFGYADQLETAMPYVAMRASHWCIDVPTSPHYNQIVDSNEVGTAAIEGSTEPMRRDLHLDGDQRYQAGFVIGHNPDHRSADGSCIFAHLWKAPDQPTAGCTAMDEAAMTGLLRWLDPSRRPLFVLLPRAEYRRLRAAWNLPSIENPSR